VGIGFGLQKIAANYVSGFIVLMDRSVSLGDVVTVEQHTGRVTKLTARYVVLRNPAGTEALIPNETLIGSAVVNHTYSDRRVHVPVPVQVGYDSDLDEVTRMLKRSHAATAASSQSRRRAWPSGAGRQRHQSRARRSGSTIRKTA